MCVWGPGNNYQLVTDLTARNGCLLVTADLMALEALAILGDSDPSE